MAFPRTIRRRVSGAGACTPGQTFDGQVGANADDGEAISDGNFVTTDIFVGHWSGPGRDFEGFMRFTNVTVPNGATIEAAYLTVRADATVNDGVGVTTNIYFSDEDDPAAPTTQAEHAADPRTTAFTAWDDEDFTVDTDTNSPSIVDVVQEIVDRPGWASGQAMLVLWDNNGTAGNLGYNIYDYNDDTTKAVKLHVQFCA